jgi:hypothetical protein
MAIRQLRDTDAYVRAIGVERLRDTGRWYETDLPQLNAPEGLSLHWTRPLDVLILLPALVAEIIARLPSKVAIFWVGAWISPLLHIASALAAAWAARALWPGSEARTAALVVVSHPVLLFAYGSVGFTDHHVLLLLLAILGIGAALRAILIPEQARWGFFAGGMFGAGLWIGPETLLIAGPVLGAFGLSWWLFDTGRPIAQQGARISFGMLGVVTLAIAVEHPPADWLLGAYDKVSVQHALMALFAGAVFSVCGLISPGAHRGSKFLAGSTAALSAGACLLVLYPHALSSSQAAADASTVEKFLPFVREMAPVPLSLASLPDLLVYATGLALFPAVLVMLRDRRWPAGLLIGAVLASTCLATILHRRFSVDLIAVAGLLGAGSVVLVAEHSRFKREALRAVAAGAAIVVLIGAPYLGLAFMMKETGNAKDKACDWSTLAHWLHDQPLRAPPDIQEPAIILTDTPDSTPELAYRTPYRFVVSPYHRAGSAFQDTFDVMTAVHDEDALRILQRRKVSFILLCTKSRPSNLGPMDSRSLEAKLRAGNNPEWLEPITLPESLGGMFRLLQRP